MAVKLFYLAKNMQKKHLYSLVRLLEWILRYVCGCEIHASMKTGTDLQLPHNGLGCVLSPRAVIGNRVKILQNVTLGGREGSGCPVIEDDVLIGAGAVVLGDITVGTGAKIGANAVVLEDVPAHSIAVGVPAVIKEKQK